MPFASLERQSHRADHHAGGGSSSADLAVENELIVVVSEGDLEQLVDRRGQGSLLVGDWHAEERNVHLRIGSVHHLVDFFKLNIEAERSTLTVVTELSVTGMRCITL